MRTFPSGFLWGTASAAHQVEGQNHNNDWWQWEARGGIQTGESSDPACDHYERYAEDFRLLRRMRNNAHRLSVEWSRIEPAPGEFDRAALRHYRDVLGELREQGISPMVTLHHFTSPLWFSRRGGWAKSGSAAAFAAFTRRVADELGDLVGHWITLNEPNIYALQGWHLGEFPPGNRGDLVGVFRVLANLRAGHLAAYRELKRSTPAVPVGIAHNKYFLEPAAPRRRDRWVSRVAQLALDRWPSSASRLELVVSAPADFIGLNHYSGQLVAFDPRLPREHFARRFNPPGLPESDFGWTVNPDWMGRALQELRGLGLPIVITENGIATSDDTVRERFLQDVLLRVWAAIQDGVDVRGYFHWTLTDNFEWARGYSMRFGLVAVDRVTQERVVKPSGHLYARICQANGLPESAPLPPGATVARA